MRFVFLFLWVFPVFATAQTIQRDELDKYTKARIKETSYETLSMKFAEAVAQRVKKVDSNIYLEIKLTLGPVYSITEGDLLYILLEKDESIPIPCARGGIASGNHSRYGSTYTGAYLYKLSGDQIEKLKKHNATGLRIGLAGEYVTFDKVKEKNALKLRKALSLVTE